LFYQWNNQGLPSDQVSTENGTILVNSERYSLVVSLFITLTDFANLYMCAKFCLNLLAWFIFCDSNQLM